MVRWKTSDRDEQTRLRGLYDSVRRVRPEGWSVVYVYAAQTAERAFFAYQDAPFAEERAAASDRWEAIQRRLHTNP